MTEVSPSSIELQNCLKRLRDGDSTARDELFRRLCGRLEQLTHRMLRGFPGVRRWEDTGDVMQNAVTRLLRALNDVKPASLRELMALSAEQIRRELIDLARHYYGPQGAGTNHASHSGNDPGNHPAHERADHSHDPGLLADWSEFHEQVGRLPEEEREVVGLLFYQELTQVDAAHLLDISVRTVQRRWHAALLKLHPILQGLVPGV